MPASDQLTALDATFLELEQADDGALMHIGGALVFEALPGGRMPAIGAVRAQLEQRLDLLPRYRQKLGAPRTGGLAWPSWERDTRFDLSAHVRRRTVPSPGDEHELLEWISDFYSHRLDRSRPLWELVLLGGLAHGRWAWFGRPTTAWSTASARSMSPICCSIQRPRRLSSPRPRPARRAHRTLTMSGTPGFRIHPSLSARRRGQAFLPLAPARTR
jgi:hypothetical protein